MLRDAYCIISGKVLLVFGALHHTGVKQGHYIPHHRAHHCPSFRIGKVEPDILHRRYIILQSILQTHRQLLYLLINSTLPASLLAPYVLISE